MCPQGLPDGVSRHWPLPGYPATPGEFLPAVGLTPVCQTWLGYRAMRP